MYGSTITDLVRPLYPCCLLIAFCAFGVFCAFLYFIVLLMCEKLFRKKNKEFKTALIIPFTIWGYQDDFKPVYFLFYKKILDAQKHSQAKIN